MLKIGEKSTCGIVSELNIGRIDDLNAVSINVKNSWCELGLYVDTGDAIKIINHLIQQFDIKPEDL